MMLPGSEQPIAEHECQQRRRCAYTPVHPPHAWRGLHSRGWYWCSGAARYGSQPGIQVVERKASRDEQHSRYLDCGPAAWDDR